MRISLPRSPRVREWLSRLVLTGGTVLASCGVHDSGGTSAADVDAPHLVADAAGVDAAIDPETDVAIHPRLPFANSTGTPLFSVNTNRVPQGLEYVKGSLYVAYIGGWIERYNIDGTLEFATPKPLPTNHTTEMAYRVRDDRLYIVNGATELTKIVQADTNLKVLRTIDCTGRGDSGMVAIDNSNDRLLVFSRPEKPGLARIAFVDWNDCNKEIGAGFNVDSTNMWNSKTPAPAVSQGIAVYGNEILYLVTRTGVPRENLILVYRADSKNDANGYAEPVHTFKPSAERAEGEGLGMDERTGSIYLGYNKLRSNPLQKISPDYVRNTYYGLNVIANPGAEASVPDSTAPDASNFWTTAGGVLAAANGPIGQTGASYWSGSDQSATATMTQLVDVADIAADIAGGKVSFTLTGLLGGREAENDNARVALTFLDSANGMRGGAGMGPVLKTDRRNTTGFVKKTVGGLVPRGTHKINLVVTFTRSDGSTTDAYADDLSLILTR
jgi:hypothetical protein